MPWPQGLKRLSPNCQEKLLSIVHADRTANQHRWVGVIHQGARENSGQGTRQINPVTSGEGVLLKVTENHHELWGAAEKWRWRLFTKNTGLCEVVRRCIWADACPVPEG